jgi:hypothetical protein
MGFSKGERPLGSALWTEKLQRLGFRSGQWYFGAGACDQCCKGCGVKFRRRWSRFLAGEGLQDLWRHGAGIDRHWLEAASGKHCAALLRKFRHRKGTAWLARRRGRLQGACNRRSFELLVPISEFLSAAIVVTQGLLTFTVASGLKDSASIVSDRVIDLAQG